MKKEELISGVIIYALGLICLTYLIVTNGDWERDGLALILTFSCCIAVMLLSAFIYVFVNMMRSRRAAIKAMGRGGMQAVMKDKVARIAYKGVYAFIKGEYPAAEEHFIKALDLADIRQNQLFCIEWLIRVYELYDDSAKLLWCFRKAVDYAPDSPETQSRLGHAYYVDGKLEKAMYCFEQALRYDPNHGYSYFSVAKIHMVRGEEDKAIECLEQLLKIQENHPLVFAELATIYAMRGDEDKCRENYEKSILCGYEQPERLSAKMTAIYKFNNADECTGDDLPHEYYRYIEKDENDAGNE